MDIKSCVEKANTDLNQILELSKSCGLTIYSENEIDSDEKIYYLCDDISQVTKLKSEVFVDNLQEQLTFWYAAYKRRPADEKKQLSDAFRLYAYHFDTYLNSSIRNGKIPYTLLVRHCLEENTNSNASQWTDIYTDIDNPECGLQQSPFSCLIDADMSTKELFYSVMENYIKIVNNNCIFMSTIFNNKLSSINLRNPVVVYRGLKIKKDAFVREELNGYTSVATKIDSAYDIAFGGVKAFNMDIYKVVILEITLGKGVSVLPINLCTIQQENEIVIVSQGKINHSSDKTRKEKIKPWFDVIKHGKYISSRFGKPIKVPVEIIPYNFIKQEDFPPPFTEISIG